VTESSILVLGAGPAGMACAMELHRAGRTFTLVEKDGQVGGLSKTYRFGEFRTDNGPHRFFSQNSYLYEFIEDLLAERWEPVDRHTRFCIGGRFYRYPVQWRDALGNMGPAKALRVVLDFLVAKLTYFRQTPADFEEFAVKTFGRSLANFNVLNYTEKIWGIPCRELSVDWARQRIHGLDLISLITNAFLNRKGPKTLVDQFYYPRGGTGLIYESILQRISATNRVMLNTVPVKLAHDGERLTLVHLNNGEQIEPAEVVSSIPITALIDMLDPAPSDVIREHAGALRYRSQVYLFITIDTPSVCRDQWIYFPDLEIPFGRISEMRNFCPTMSPEGKTSLFVEFFCWKGDRVWKSSKEDLMDLAVPWLTRLGFLTRDEILDCYHIRREDAYPVYDLTYGDHLRVVKDYLDGFRNLFYIGRPGRFRYTNQDHSLEMGIVAARSILDNTRYDLEAGFSEAGYFEGGAPYRANREGSRSS
jgi:protoporphyrinogen oxidase